MLGLRRLIEGVKEFNKKPIIIYVDFKKAFDSINRKVMIKILKAYGIPNCLVNVIALFYENTRARVITPDGNIDSFVIKKGVLQSDTLAPYLFVIMIDFVMRNVYNGKEENLGFTLKRRMSRRHPAEVITDLDFADDLALLTQEITQAQEKITRLEEEAAYVGLYCTAKKTELQVFNHQIPVEVRV